MAWTVWVVIALAACIIELFTTDFTFLMLGLAALVTAAFAAVGIDTAAWQIVIYAVIATILILFLRPWARDKFNPKGAEIGNVAGLVGKTAVVLEETSKHSGLVRIGGDTWTARTNGATYPAGAELVVVAIDGASAVVEARQPAEPSGAAE